MYKAHHISPMIPSFNLQGTRDFFIDLLAFESVMDEDAYVILHKDTLTIHILRAGSDIGQMEFYLEIDDVETLWNSIKDKIAGLKVRPPFNQDYGMREIHMEVPHTKTLLFIGQVIKN